MSVSINGNPQANATSVGPDSVDSAAILDGEVMMVDIADLAVSTAKIADGAVTDVKITGPISASKLDTAFVELAGGTMTGLLTLSGAPTADLEAATKKYVDDEVAGIDLSPYLEKSGDTMTGSLTLQNAGIFQSMGTFGATFINALPSGSSNPTLVIRNNGSLEAGNGVLGTDTKLQRLSSNVWGINDGQIRTSVNPSNDDDLTRKKYVDDSIGAIVIPSTAADIANVPAFSIAATDVQAAINELAQESVNKGGDTMTGSLLMAAGSSIIATGTTANTNVFEAKVSGNINESFSIDADGELNWDTNVDGAPDVTVTPAGARLDMGAGNQIRVTVDPANDNDLSRKKYVDDEITSAVNAIVFGDEYQQEYEATVLATSSGTYSNFMTLTTPSLPAGTYRVGWRFDYAKSASSCVGQYRLQVDNTTDLDEKLLSSAANNIEVQYSNFDNIVLGAGVHTIDVDARKDSGGGSFSIDEGKIEIWRVA